MTEPIDQPTKDLIEKEAKDIADKKWFFKENADRAFKTGYVAGATVWAEKLRQLETQSHDQVRIIEHLEEKLKQERNKAIDECKNIVRLDFDVKMGIADGLIEKFESLKDKSHE